MKIALVYDRVNKIGGAERVLVALHNLFPQAPLYTTVYHSKGAPWAKAFKVIPSFLQKWPIPKNRHEFYPWLAPFAFESFSFDEFEVVISISSAEAKGIITKPSTFHLCYCLTPTRYLWGDNIESYKVPLLAKPLLRFLRNWDKVAAHRPDAYLSISQNVKERIKKYYNLNSTVVYPPVDTQFFEPGEEKEDFFLVVSRLVPYKKVDLVLEAFNEVGWPLKVIGTGLEEGRFKRMAKKNIQFLGQLTDSELLSYYQRCRAVLFATEEDFGLVPLEAQACGKPVIALKKGGALETIIEGKTGKFFYPQTKEALLATLAKFKDDEYYFRDCRENAEKFSLESFKKNFTQAFDNLWQSYLKNTFS